jgi:hypothetical protein
MQLLLPHLHPGSRLRSIHDENMNLNLALAGEDEKMECEQIGEDEDMMTYQKCAFLVSTL